MQLIKVFSVIYLTAVCAAQVADEYDDVTSTFKDMAPTTQPMTTAPPVPFLQKQSAWLDVFPSEKVVLNCSVAGSSDWAFTWSRSGQDMQASDPSVSLSAEGSLLTVTAEAQTSSGSYSCKGRHKTKGVTTAESNKLELKVYPNVPKPILRRTLNYPEMFPKESITFNCTVDVSSGWEYLWYFNGAKIPPASSDSFTIASIDHPNSGEYHCKAKRGSFNTDDSEKTTLKVSDPPNPSLSLLTPWKDVFENETVDFECKVDGPDWTFTWYKNQVHINVDPYLPSDREEPYFNITSITQDYKGGYSCKAHLERRGVSSGFSNTVDVEVYDDTPKPTLSKNPAFNLMYVGETVNFTCNVDVSSGWKYQWYKDGQALHETSRTISFRLDLSNGGEYSCAASRGDATYTNVSKVKQQDVLEIPVPSLKKSTPWSDVFPDESVKFSCEMKDSSDWIYTWYRDGQEVQADGVVSFDSSRATLSINSASPVHAGQYTCMGSLNGRSVSSRKSSGFNLTVHDKKPSVTLTQDPEYKVMFPGESVSFSCNIKVSSGWKYQWYKDGKHLGHSKKTYPVKSIETTSGGLYKCEVQRGTDEVVTYSSQPIPLKVEGNKPKPSMTQHPNIDKLYAGEPVSFECQVEHSSGWEYSWYKDGNPLPVTSKTYSINDAKLSSSGTYKCMAKRNKTMYDTEDSDGRLLTISEIPVPSLKKVTEWLDVFPTESVTLSCVMDGSSDWKYTWYKDGQEVQKTPDNALSFDRDASRLNITSASSLNRGQYNCSAKLKSRSVSSTLSSGLTLSVYDTTPRVMLMQNPSHDVMHTGDKVTFSCHINVSTGWKYLWFKDDIPLAEPGANHSITSVLTKNAGSYKCQTKRGNTGVFHSSQSQVVKLTVEERPKAEIILLTGWSEVFSTDTLLLNCGVQNSQDSWNYTWYKADQPIKEQASEQSQTHKVTPQNDPDQSEYTCEGKRIGRPSYSKISDHYKTKNLLLKRRILLSISGCIFFGIIFVFLGCIILRVTRKPAADEYKPEEAELFARMDQIKDSDDAPCPLVQYITDATLNAPPKEGDENGMICSETTPLPITPQEDQVVTTESPDEADNNGGLVSFKQ
ncbi:obscurin [Sparus aurata]|uniref:obscurin n=1 Tax=Sparus aurata TaxID=8175 RepID=UPI0011C134EB|nr:obscurin-like [Sparus aurata]XP_030278897.1 obscurin-like [Sparus aurata]